MSGDGLDARFATEMGRLLGPGFPDEIGLAVSGGGDSMAMLALAHNWTRVWGVGLWVVTVDHGLRPESADEAAMVAAECATLGHPHATLRWQPHDDGNVMDAARRARLSLIDRWRGRLGHVLMAHTRDDVAETFLMRLARGAGVDGLSAMAARRRVVPAERAEGTCTGESPPAGDGREPGFEVIRPLLEVRREELRHYLRVLRVPWADDPTNTDPAHDRARLRALLPALAAEGLDADALAGAALRLRRARAALAARSSEMAERARLDDPRWDETGALSFDRDVLAGVERETQARILSAALRWVAGAEYGPRAAPLEALLDRAFAGGGGTLHGCEVACDGPALRVWREYAAVRDIAAPAGEGAAWDGRWRLSGAAADGLEIRALGDAGWAQIPEKPAGTPPHRLARTLPALWQGDRLVAFGPAAVGPAHEMRRLPGPGGARDFAALLLSD